MTFLMGITMHKVYIVGVDGAVVHMFQQEGFKIVNTIAEADLVCFTGGEDVDPSLYGCQKHPSTYSNHYRDEAELAVVDECIERNIPMVGICRGGQLLNVVNGGQMYQDVRNHTRDHYALIEGEPVFVTSTHHQMMKPSEQGTVLGVAYVSPSRVYVDAQGRIEKTEVSKEEPDIEVVYYHLTRSLCFQPHPEFNIFSTCTRVFFQLISKYIL